jgi:hypothetical protein
MVNLLKSNIKKLVDGYITANPNVKKSPEAWMGSTSPTMTTPLLTASEFYNSVFLKSKMVEGIVFLMIASYLNSKRPDGTDYSNRGIFYRSGSSILRDINKVIEKEPYFLKGTTSGSLSYNKDYMFTENVSVITETSFRNVGNITYRKTTKTLHIKSDINVAVSNFNRTILTIPYNVTEITGTINNGVFTPNVGSETLVEVSNILTITSNSTTFLQLITDLRRNLYGFLDTITIFSNQNLKTAYSFFYVNSINDKIALETITSFIKDFSRLFYIKDLINDDFYQESQRSSLEKTSANNFEFNTTKDGQQLIFFDIIDITVSDMLKEISLQELTSLFPGINTNLNFLSYTLLYKELNPVLRDIGLIDSQEFIFARLLSENGKDFIFRAKLNGLSHLFNIDTIYRKYFEEKEILRLNSNFYRYRYYYNNMYFSRISSESDLIGYYIGDRTVESEFINNYGSKDYQRREIENFLNIYKTTRDYYYKVLLNKSFIQEDQYKLYERLMITFMAIERFLNSKIENLKNPDFFNTQDIFNFLESYGLGILNDKRFDIYVTDVKNYRLNIIKYFNDLVKLKGSKNVIELLLEIFEVGDITTEINKFILLENVPNLTTQNGKTLYQEGTLKFIEVPYSSDNGTRSIFESLTSKSYEYEEFLENDQYWNPEEVPSSKLIEYNIDAVQTKYMGLILSENIYRKYILSRYAFSTVKYLEEKLLKTKIDQTILYNTKVDVEEDILSINKSELSIYSIFESLKLAYNALLRLYELNSSIPKSSHISGKYYGINQNINWDFLINSSTGLLKDIVTNYVSPNINEFILANKKDESENPAELTTFSRFNIYKETDDWINYDPIISNNNLKLFYRKYDYNNLTEVAKQLRDISFSTHKTISGKQEIANTFSNSGNYVLETFENLNLIRIDNSNHDLWMHILSSYYSQDYDISKLSATFDASGSNFDYNDLYDKVISKIMKLPVDYFNGLLSPYGPNSSLNQNYNFRNLIEKLFEQIYLTDNDPLSVPAFWIDSDNNKLYRYENGSWVEKTKTVSETAPLTPSIGNYWIDSTNSIYSLKVYNGNNWIELDRYYQTDEPKIISDEISNSDILKEALNIIIAGTGDYNTLEIEEKITEYTELVFKFSNIIKTLYASKPFMQFSLSLRTEENETLRFVQTAIEVFLSYTSKLYYSTFKKNYNTTSEIVPYAEDIRHLSYMNKTDLIFYDEKLDIQRISGGG